MDVGRVENLFLALKAFKQVEQEWILAVIKNKNFGEEDEFDLSLEIAKNTPEEIFEEDKVENPVLRFLSFHRFINFFNNPRIQNIIDLLCVMEERDIGITVKIFESTLRPKHSPRRDFILLCFDEVNHYQAQVLLNSLFTHIK